MLSCYHVQCSSSQRVLMPNLACHCRLNNPNAHTFCDNCNVLLSAAMDKAGLSEYCDASEEVQKLLAHMLPSSRVELACLFFTPYHSGPSSGGLTFSPHTPRLC